MSIFVILYEDFCTPALQCKMVLLQYELRAVLHDFRLGGAEGKRGVRVLGWFGKEVRVLGDGERVLD